MQLAGTQFTNVSAIFGNDVSTLPDFPAEIRAPAGSLFGVSGFQVCFSSNEVFTPGDESRHISRHESCCPEKRIFRILNVGGTLIVNEDAFDKGNLKKAHYETNPLTEEDGQLAGYRVHKVSMTRLTRDAVDGLGLTVRESDRCRNFFALGLVFWLYDRESKPTEEWVKQKFAKHPSVVEANLRALKAGSNFGFSTEQFYRSLRSPFS